MSRKKNQKKKSNNQDFIGYIHPANYAWLGLSTTGLSYHRRVRWQDLQKAGQKARRELWNLLTTMKDFLLIRSRSFVVNSTSTSSSSANGSVVKLVPSSYGMTRKGNKYELGAFTNTTFSGGSVRKRRGSRQYGTKFCVCGRAIGYPNWVHGKKRCYAR